MIKLENTSSLPQAKCLLVLESRGDAPAISLTTETIREEINGQWTDSAMNSRQVVSCFIDGKPVKLTAKIPAIYAVECPACGKVVVEIEAKMSLSSAYEKGDKSKEICQISLIRVVEVWATSTKRLWAATDGAQAGKLAASIDLNNGNGRISKPEVPTR